MASPAAEQPATSEFAQAHPSGIVPQLQNLVATVNLGCKLTLQTIASKARNAEYNPRVRVDSATQQLSNAAVQLIVA